jgi:hypothetical protein
MRARAANKYDALLSKAIPKGGYKPVRVQPYPGVRIFELSMPHKGKN